MKRRVALRTFLHISVIGIIIGLPGLLLDFDHAVSLMAPGNNGRWFHHLATANPVVFILYSVLSGAIVCTFVLGWFGARGVNGGKEA